MDSCPASFSHGLEYHGLRGACMIDSSLMPYHRPLGKLHLPPPQSLPLCTWATTPDPQKRPQYRNTTQEPATLESEQIQEQREIADHLSEDSAEKHKFPRSSMTSEMGIRAAGSSPPSQATRHCGKFSHLMGRECHASRCGILFFQ